jgi:hypothetical protein
MEKCTAEPETSAGRIIEKKMEISAQEKSGTAEKLNRLRG